MKKIILAKGKEESVERKHPWIFSGAILTADQDIEEGERVGVYDRSGNCLAIGHYQEGSIRVRIFSFTEQKIDQTFWDNKILSALLIRQACGISAQSDTNCFRLIHGEGDGLPGLIIDIYHSTAVVQCHSIGMYMEQASLKQALLNVMGDRISSIYSKSKSALPQPFSDKVTDGLLLGTLLHDTVLENGHQFIVNWQEGQKTGFFLDQRENRKLAAAYASGKKVLNAFCYSGGFSVYALKNGAASVDSVDISAKAIEWTNNNVLLNGSFSNHHGICTDVKSFLKNSNEKYGFAIVDPPAFAKTKAKRHQAVQAYKRLNEMALKRMEPNSVLFTFSCSQVVNESLFYNTIVAAAIESGREISVLHRLSQPPDHPPSLFHPEGNYLKGLALWVR